MGKGSGSFRLRALYGAFVAGLMLASALPGVALAANTASFSSASPKSGSSTANRRPSISVTVYDRYGVSGSKNYALYVDGTRYTPKLTRVHGYGLRKFKLTFTPAAPLAMGQRTIKVTTHDLHHKNSSYTWKFTVVDAAPPVTTTDAKLNYTVTGAATISLSATDNVGVAHTWYTLDGGLRMEYLSPIIVPADVVTLWHRLSFWSEDAAGNVETAQEVTFYVNLTVAERFKVSHAVTTPTCVIAGCHASDLTVIHSGAPRGCATCHLSDGISPPNDCSSCHPAERVHPRMSEHAADVASCAVTGCHTGGGDVSVIHAGTEHSCATCHTGNGDPTKDCATEGCHDTTHAGRVEHVITGSTCATGTCHASKDAAAIHMDAPDRCVSCHTGAADAILVCATCHVGTNAPTHASIGTSHTAEVGVCVNSHCHVTDVSAIHAESDRTCSACHATGQPASTDCAAQCHDEDPLAIHSGHIGTKHDAPVGISCVTGSGCHSGSVTAIHGTHCDACHGDGIDPTTTCNDADCHHETFDELHADAATKHVVADGNCSGSPCHANDLSVVHEGTVRECGACHATGVTPPSDCESALCHQGGTSIWHKIGTKHNPPVGGCVVAAGTGQGCHDLGIAATHVGTDADCGACHWNETPPTSVCTDCHTGKNAPEHAIATEDHTPTVTGCSCHTDGHDVSEIHAKAEHGCSTCHTGNGSAIKDCATVGCHPAGSLGTHESHPATVETGTMTINGTGYGVFTCVTCHDGFELQALHGEDGTKNSCATCHPDPASSLDPWAGGCQQGDCHAVDTPSEMHGSIDTTHVLEAQPSCTTGDGCHDGGSDVAAIHAGTTLGCETCHGGDKTPTKDCEADGCHLGEFPPASHDSHPSTVTSGTITIGGVGYKYDCTFCHESTELQTLHGEKGGGESCSTCHPEPADPLKDTWQGGCVEGGCHVADTKLAMHGSIGSSHNGVVPGCTSDEEACHSGGSDVAVIHKDTTLGCANCHGDGKTPIKLCATEDCHLEGAKGHDSHPASVSTGTIASYGEFTCADCHGEMELQLLHGEDGSKNSCAKCHPDPASSFVDPWSGGCVEAGCHAVDSTLQLHGSIEASHSLEVPPTCTAGDSCHTGGSNIAEIHVGTKKGCFTCHNSTTPPTAECATDGCHGPDDKVVYPGGHGDLEVVHHATPASQEITIAGVPYGPVQCSTCHGDSLITLHAGAETPVCAACHPSVGTKLDGAWGKGCVQGSCHALGGDVPMHADVDLAHETTPGAATSCGTVANGSFCHADLFSLASIHKDTDLGCGSCHGNPDLRVAAAMAAGARACPACHDAHDPSAAHVANVSVEQGMGVADGFNYGLHRCNECHASTDYPALHGDLGHNESCAKCHPDAVGELTQKTDGGCVVPGACHNTGSAAPMHADLGSSHLPTAGTSTSCGNALNSMCHESSNLANIAKIHSVDGNGDGSAPGCAACHANEDHAASNVCSDCHPAHNLETAHASTVTTGSIMILDTSMGVFACADCHTSAGLIGAHGGDTSCPTCHPSPVSSMGDWNKTCTQNAACHNPSQGSPLVRMHHDIDTDHNPYTALDTCAGPDCHSFPFNVALIHNDTVKKCTACHDGRPVAELTKTCATCHTETGASEAAHVAVHALPETRIDGCDDADCHPGANLTAITVDKGEGAVPAHATCAGCHKSTDPDHVSAIVGSDLSCNGCHASGGHRPKHEVVREDGCTGLGCHPDSETNLMDIHPGCPICHSSTRPAVVAAITGDDTTCATCHPFSLSAPELHPSYTTSHTVTPQPGCTTNSVDCHVGGANVIAIHAGGPDTPKGCAACHDNATQTLDCFASCHSSAGHEAAHAVVRSGDTCVGNGAGCHPATLDNLFELHPSCDTCHKSTDPAVVAAVAKTDGSGKVCSVCHGSTIGSTDLHPSYTTSHTVGVTPSCTTDSDCHVGGANVIAIHAGGPNAPKGCAACHEAATQTLDCFAGCHSSTGHRAVHEVVRSDNCTDVGCHLAALTNLMDLHPDCDTCHKSAKQPVIDAIALGGVIGKACGTCHGTTISAPALHPSYDSTHTTGVSTSCAKAGCHPVNLITIHAADGDNDGMFPGCAACHAAGKTLTKDCNFVGCHPDITSPETHGSRYTAAHNAPGSGCTDAACHPVSALTIHGRTGCYDSCHNGTIASLTLSCNSGTCHSGVYGGSTIDSHMAVHTSVYTNNETCVQCHSSNWHDDDNPVFLATITAGGSCSTIPNTWNAVCHSGTPGSSTARGFTHDYNNDSSCWDSSCH